MKGPTHLKVRNCPDNKEPHTNTKGSWFIKVWACSHQTSQFTVDYTNVKINIYF